MRFKMVHTFSCSILSLSISNCSFSASSLSSSARSSVFAFLIPGDVAISWTDLLLSESELDGGVGATICCKGLTGSLLGPAANRSILSDFTFPGFTSWSGESVACCLSSIECDIHHLFMKWDVECCQIDAYLRESGIRYLWANFIDGICKLLVSIKHSINEDNPLPIPDAVTISRF